MELTLTPLELLDRLARLVTPPRIHKHRYCGVLAPNAKLRREVIESAGPAGATLQVLQDAQDKMGLGEVGDPENEKPTGLFSRAAARCWALLLARIYECLPLLCPRCGEPMRIIAFVTDGVSVRRILEHVGEPADPPRIAPAHPCAIQSCFACVPAQAFHGLSVRCSVAAHPPAGETFDQTPVFDPLAPAPEPAFEFDQRDRPIVDPSCWVIAGRIVAGRVGLGAIGLGAIGRDTVGCGNSETPASISTARLIVSMLSNSITMLTSCQKMLT